MLFSKKGKLQKNIYKMMTFNMNAHRIRINVVLDIQIMEVQSCMGVTNNKYQLLAETPLQRKG